MVIFFTLLFLFVLLVIKNNMKMYILLKKNLYLSVKPDFWKVLFIIYKTLAKHMLVKLYYLD